MTICTCELANDPNCPLHGYGETDDTHGQGEWTYEKTLSGHYTVKNPSAKTAFGVLCIGYFMTSDRESASIAAAHLNSTQQALTRAEAQVAELRTFCGDVAGVLAGPAFKGDPRIEYIANRARDAALAPTAERAE